MRLLKKMAGRKRHRSVLFFFFRLLAPLTFHCCYKYNQSCWKLTECFWFGWLRIMWSNGHLWNDPARLEFGASKSVIDVICMHKYMNDAKKNGGLFCQACFAMSKVLTLSFSVQRNLRSYWVSALFTLAVISSLYVCPKAENTCVWFTISFF